MTLIKTFINIIIGVFFVIDDRADDEIKKAFSVKDKLSLMAFSLPSQKRLVGCD